MHASISRVGERIIRADRKHRPAIRFLLAFATDVKPRSGHREIAPSFQDVLSHRGHRVMRDPLLIEREPESGSIGYLDFAVSFDGERFAEHLVAAE